MRLITDIYTITQTGANITTGAASARVAIPTTSSGVLPVAIRVTATVAAHVKIGDSAVAAVAADTLLGVGYPVILAVPRGVTHIAAIQDAAAGSVNVVPLEDS